MNVKADTPIEIQAVWHKASLFSIAQSEKWCLDNDFLIHDYRKKLDEDGNIAYHIHAQFDPERGVDGTWGFISDTFPDGISASVCQQKEKSMKYIRGIQSADDPLEFIMSDETLDSYGDIIVADGWQLADFKRNPIALWGHDHKSPVGVWEKVRVEGVKLIGKLKLAAAGTSAEIDTLRSLVEQRIIKAVSVGFSGEEYEYLRDDENDYITGIKFLKSKLHECSLVSVGANPNALAIAKSHGLDEVQLADLLKLGRDIHGRNAAPLAKLEKTLGTADRLLSQAGCPNTPPTVH